MNEMLNMLESSKSNIDMKDSTKEIYNEAISLLDKLEKKDPQKYKEALSEYKQLRKKIISSLEDDNKITKEELLSLKLELDDLKNLDSNAWEKFKESNNKDNFKNKNIDDYSEIEARVALEYLNSNYNSYSGWRLAWFDEDNINELKDKRDVNVFQQRLINKILWENNEWFNENSVHWYNNKKWNFIISKNEIEYNIKEKDFQELNTLALKNYFNLLDSNWTFEVNYLNKIFWTIKTAEIMWFIERESEKNDDLKNIKSINKSENILEESIKNEVNDKLNTKNLKDFSDGFSSLWKEVIKEEKVKETLFEKSLEKLEKDKEKLKKLFLQPLIEKWKDDNEANKIVNKLLEDINDNLKSWKLEKVIGIINTFNKQNKTKIDIRETAIMANKIVKSETQVIELNTKVLKVITAENIEDIATWKVEYSEVLKELAKKDSTLEKLLKQVEKIKKQIKKEQEKEEKINNTQSEKSINNWKIELKSGDTKEVNYDVEGSKIEYQMRWKEVTLKLNSEEQTIIKNNPENIENIINFYDTLDRVWLNKLWDIKEQIFNSIWNKSWIWFNIEWDYLNGNETQIFLNSILKSVWKKTIEWVAWMDEFIAIMETQNNTQISWEEKKVNIHWDTNIEELFINKYFPRWSIHFNTSLFEKSL